MTAPLDPEDLANARVEAFKLLGTTAHYCRCAQMHLQVADDSVALLDLHAVRTHLSAALREFKIIQRGIIERGAAASTSPNADEAA